MTRSNTLDGQLSSLIAALATVRTSGAAAGAIERFRIDAQAALFHLTRRVDGMLAVALLGGTGTGKSTLFNRILGGDFTATSFRRTFTAGPVAAAADPSRLPSKWLGLEAILIDPAKLPARGEPDLLMIVQAQNDLTSRIVLVDTPDLDGDQPLHHVQADRVFRWADVLLFLVTPEKYQMTELLPYYRLSARYGIPTLFAMNKAESAEVVHDFAQQLQSRGDAGALPIAGRLFAIARDDAGFEPPAEMNLQSLRAKLATIEPPSPDARHRGDGQRVKDLLDRLRDQVILPLRRDRREADQLVVALRAMERPVAGVDVNPLMSALQRRLQQRSILYLIGPGRMLDRVRQVPGLIARLPRSTWDLLRKGQVDGKPTSDASVNGEGGANLRAGVIDQFSIVQSRIDDVIRSSGTGDAWIGNASADYAATKLPSEEAARIADEELETLKKWMNEKWNGTPRDTAIIKKLIQHLPGGEKLTALSEAAPYLVIAASAVATHALFGADMLVFGGYSLVTWLTEKASNEVASRARMTNQRIGERFAQLAHAQIRKTCEWIEQRAPAAAELDRIERIADAMSAQLEEA